MCCLLAGPDLWKRMLYKCFVTMMFTCLLLSWYKMSRPFRGSNNVMIFPFTFHTFRTFGQLVLHPLSRIFSHLKDSSCSDLYPLIHPSRRPLALGRGIHSARPTLSIYDFAHSLPLGGVDRDFLFTEDETWRHFSDTFRGLCRRGQFNRWWYLNIRKNFRCDINCF